MVIMGIIKMLVMMIEMLRMMMMQMIERNEVAGGKNIRIRAGIQR